jgi:hypothetical protein
MSKFEAIFVTVMSVYVLSIFITSALNAFIPLP